MDIIRAHAVNNLCYIHGRKMTPKGIVVYSTGANNYKDTCTTSYITIYRHNPG